MKFGRHNLQKRNIEGFVYRHMAIDYDVQKLEE